MSISRSHIFFILLVFSFISVKVLGNGPGTRFIENNGQWHKEVLYKAAIPGGDLYILKNKLKYVFYQTGRKNHEGEFNKGNLRKSALSKNEKLIHSVEVSFQGANSASEITGTKPNPEALNYFCGTDEHRWTKGVNSYSDVVIDDLYEGIDFHLYSSSSGIKYDFIVSPGIDPAQIKMIYDGQNELKIHEGKVVIGTVHGYFFENSPISFSESNLKKESVPTEFKLLDNQVSFHFPQGYDTHSKLVIDPELIFSTYSGSFADNWGFTATFDDEGNLYSGGIVLDVGYPVTNGVFQPEHAGQWDVGILKYDSAGKELLWATYLGGSFSDTPQSIIVNNEGDLVIYGTTSSPDFPMTNHSYRTNFRGGKPIYDSIPPLQLVGGLPMRNGTDIFLAILGDDGTTLKGATFIGGNSNDGIMEKFHPLTKNYGDQFRGEVIVDNQDNIYVASNTSSTDFPIINGPQKVYGGDVNDGVLMKFNQNLSDLQWSTYMGGSGMDALFSIKVDTDGNVFASGGSNSVDFPVSLDAIKTEKPSKNDIDGIIVKLSSDGTKLLKSTFVGTPNYDQAYFLELDSSNNVYVLGQTQGNYPVTDGVYANTNSGQFIHKLGNELDTTYFSTVIGSGSGSPDFSPTAFLVNECENIFISGWGGVANDFSRGYIGGSTFGLPITNNAFQSQTDGSDFYMVVLLQNAKQLLYGTYFGELNGVREHVDGGTSRFDKKGIVYQSVCASCSVCAGCGGTDGFPTWPPDVWSSTNNSPNCNNAAFKFDLASLLAKFETDTEGFSNRGIRQGCYPVSLVFLNESFGGENFHWDFGEGSTTDQEDSITITYEKPGRYPVVLTATDINTCVRVSEARGVITVHDYNFSIMPDDSVCTGESITLAADGGILYNWEPSQNLQNPSTSRPVATPDTTTIYSVKIEDSNGCKGEDSLEITVIPRVVANFEFIKDYDCFETPVLKFTNNSENASKFLWDFGDGKISEEFEPTYQYNASDSLKQYNVTLTAGESFCNNQLSLPVESVTPFVPNFISPNGDGKNDVFKIITDSEIDLTIHNRYGKEVFSAENYQNTWQAGDLASGVYFYEIILGNKNTRCNGWIQVMR